MERLAFFLPPISKTHFSKIHHVCYHIRSQEKSKIDNVEDLFLDLLEVVYHNFKRIVIFLSQMMFIPPLDLLVLIYKNGCIEIFFVFNKKIDCLVSVVIAQYRFSLCTHGRLWYTEVTQKTSRKNKNAQLPFVGNNIKTHRALLTYKGWYLGFSPFQAYYNNTCGNEVE